MRSLTIFLYSFFTLLAVNAAVATSAFCAGPDWVFLDENAESRFFFDQAGTTHPKEGIVRVRTRVVYTKEGKADAQKMLANDPKLAKLYESRYLHDLDCADRESRLLEATHLDKDGASLKSTDLSPFSQWEAIPPDARMDMVVEKVCGQ
jgi:hypothetical protein